MFSFPVAEQYSYFVACMSLIFFLIPTLSPFLFLESMYFFIIWPDHLFPIYSGQVNFVFYHIRTFGLKNLSIIRGYAFFLVVTAHSIFTFKMRREMQIYPDSNEDFLCKMPTFVCVSICSMICCSPSPVSLSDWYSLSLDASHNDLNQIIVKEL